ncbi:ferredoxin reductase domain-containing protein [Ramlibacter alkalitolerans]|uniref:Nucleoid-associated protein n=1 Tax=Ramlibacter alkalitolerans TaxID=2039631 RepID=A0ABS1JVD5_9BURK|nr:hypothetical protein [Ramlibacter alkalitolerans]MBL0427831.1 hypothetical protein [Ramlibacter alkalitolerans]
MSTKAILTVMHNGVTVGLLHTHHDGDRLAMSTAILDALAHGDTPEAVVKRLITRDDENAHNWTELKSMPDREFVRSERQFEYMVNLADVDGKLTAPVVFIHDRYNPNEDITCTPGELLDYVRRTFRKVPAERFGDPRDQSRDFEGLKAETLASLKDLEGGLVAHTLVPDRAPEVAEPKLMTAKAAGAQVAAQTAAKGIDPVRQEIARQVQASLLSLGQDPRACTFVLMNDGALRVNKGNRNVDIKLDEASDLYDVQLHTIDKKTFDVTTKEHKGVFFDQLPDMLKHLTPQRNRDRGLDR